LKRRRGAGELEQGESQRDNQESIGSPKALHDSFLSLIALLLAVSVAATATGRAYFPIRRRARAMKTLYHVARRRELKERLGRLMTSL
jgi:hypothetical protein